MVRGVEHDPKYIALQRAMEEEEDAEQWQQLYQEAADMERAARASAERCRISCAL